MLVLSAPVNSRSRPEGSEKLAGILGNRSRIGRVMGRFRSSAVASAETGRIGKKRVDTTAVGGIALLGTPFIVPGKSMASTGVHESYQKAPGGQQPQNCFQATRITASR